MEWNNTNSKQYSTRMEQYNAKIKRYNTKVDDTNQFYYRGNYGKGFWTKGPQGDACLGGTSISVAPWPYLINTQMKCQFQKESSAVNPGSTDVSAI